jgi:peptide chain release factor 1
MYVCMCRCTDHRLGQNFPLQMILGGDLGTVIGQCVAMEQQEKMRSLLDDKSQSTVN